MTAVVVDANSSKNRQESIEKEVESVTAEIESLKEQIRELPNSKKQPASVDILKTHKQVNNLTGLPTKQAFDNPYNYITPAAQKCRYWWEVIKEGILRSKVKRKFARKSPKH